VFASRDLTALLDVMPASTEKEEDANGGDADEEQLQGRK